MLGGQSCRKGEILGIVLQKLCVTGGNEGNYCPMVTTPWAGQALMYALEEMFEKGINHNCQRPY